MQPIRAIRPLMAAGLTLITSVAQGQESVNSVHVDRAPADTSRQAADSTLFDRLSAHGWTLQRTLAGPDATEGATIGFVAQPDEKAVYRADFALIYEPRRRVACPGLTCVYRQFSVDGKVASDENSAQDALRFRGRLRIDRGSPVAFRGVTLFAGAKLETNRDFTTQNLLAETEVTFTDRALAMGFIVPSAAAAPNAPVRFRWRPFAGVDVGAALRQQPAGREDVIVRLVPRVRGELFLDFVERGLGVEDVSVYADNTLHLLPLEDRRRARNLLVSGLEIRFNENVGFQVEYTNGEASPEYEKTNSVAGGLSVRFGKPGRR